MLDKERTVIIGVNVHQFPVVNQQIQLVLGRDLTDDSIQYMESLLGSQLMSLLLNLTVKLRDDVAQHSLAVRPALLLMDIMIQR